jgi:uncharacterized protein (DUF1697 family)
VTAARAPAVAGTHVALLRGINVGRAKRVAMADLRALVEGLGYEGVRTLLNSGNVVFAARPSDRRDHAARIEKALDQELRVAARVTVLPAVAVAAVIRENTLLDKAKDPTRLLVTVFREDEHREKLRELARRAWSPDAITVGRHAAYVWCAHGLLESPLFLEIGKALGDGITSRNWATMTKLQALLDGP